MMRARSNASWANWGMRGLWLCAPAVFFAACSSAPLDDSGAEPPPSSAAGSGSGGSDAAAPSGVDYQKQDYPAGPYGTGEGSTLENFAFLGWRDPVAAGYDQTKLEQVRLSEFYDPSGSKGIKLIWINASAVWCSVCRSEMRDIKNNGVRAEFAPKGVQLVVTLFEDNKSGPARPLDLHNWGSAKEHAIDFPLLLDPGFKLGAFFSSDATPLNMLVDARTMRVLDETMGYSADYWQGVDKLLAKLP
jgi:hypothetical protein